MIEFVTLPATPAHGAVTLDYEWLAGGSVAAPLVVFLHAGPDPYASHREWAAALCRALGFRGLLYARPGYGPPAPRPHAPPPSWPIDFLHRQADDILPALLDALDISPSARCPRMWLVGHRDGASITLLYASAQPAGLAGAVVIAPHTFAPHAFAEPSGADGPLRIRAAFETTNLRDRLSRYHDDVDPGFRDPHDAPPGASSLNWHIEAALHAIRCPLLAIEGFAHERDAGGSGRARAHLESIERHVRGAARLEIAGTPPDRDGGYEHLNASIARFIGACAPLSRN
ncbi:hypothetical protein B0G84_3358 [Paraburkholderia sp. BL8N3]|nr:alpha/beta hydrolase [Paraburkholderia sp. BL8N3]TCK38055.1 hypothetical protein B0G84_3358 [Paraburkholderia sp. BL8N3]